MTTVPVRKLLRFLFPLGAACLLSCTTNSPQHPQGSETEFSGDVRRAAVQDSESGDVVVDYGKAIHGIAEAIERLKGQFPQLAEFTAEKHGDSSRLAITYGYRTHRAKHRGGWTAGVPNPDPDGVWFYIDFHDPGSAAQIHTQPVVPPLHFRDRKVTFLILEGETTKRLAASLHQIMLNHGVREGAP